MGRNPPNKTLCFWGYSSYGMIERNPEMKSNPFHSVHAFRLSPSRNPVGFVLGSNDDNKLLPNRLFSSMNTWNRSIRISWFMSWPVAVFFCLSLRFRTLKKSWVVSFFFTSNFSYNRKIEYPGVSWCLKICARRIQLICAATFGLVGSASWREPLRMLGNSVAATDLVRWRGCRGSNPRFLGRWVQ